MGKEIEQINSVLDRMDTALGGLQETAQGRVYVVGTKILFGDKFGVVTHLNKGSEDPTGSTINIRLEDGTIVDAVSVTSATLQLLKQ